MHARAVSMTPARAVAPAPAGGRARVANAHAAGSGNLSGRANNAKSLGNGNARVSLGSGPRRAARRAPAPARAELTDAQDAGEMQKIVSRIADERLHSGLFLRVVEFLNKAKGLVSGCFGAIWLDAYKISGCV